MEQIKRPQNNSFNSYDHSKRQKIQITTNQTNCISEETITHFEYLSNEVIYEIFEFLDYFHVYEGFFNLNRRFDHLLTHSNLPIKINFSSMSKSSLKCYNTDIIQTNIHRISSLHFSDVFMYEFLFSSIGKISKFSRVETLILENIESAYLENLLDQLPSLSFLSSLIIASIDEVNDKNTIYHQIFRLPTLKYCKLSLNGWTSYPPSPVSTNEHSSIEYLIITNPIFLHELDSLLSYVPHLRRLSFHSLSKSLYEQTKISSCLLNHLTHISLKISSIKFDQFEQLFVNMFRAVQVLRFTVDYDVDRAYMDANKWKQLILSYIPNLRIFDIRRDICFRSWYDYTATEDTISRFKSDIKHFESSFWSERQWFFAHHCYQTRYGDHVAFYSTNPYKRKDYILYKQLEQNTSVHHSESKLVSVQKVHIQSKEGVTNCINYFPNAAELTFDDKFSASHASLTVILSRILPLHQLTKLAINSDRFSVQKVIKILCCASNIHTLTLKSMACYQKVNDYTLIEQSEDFQLVSNSNVITTVTCEAQCTLEQINLLVALCPRIQHLTIDTLARNLEPITRRLLDKTNQNMRHLCSVCFSRVCQNWFQKLDTLIKSETLLDDYALKQLDRKLHLWW